MYSGSGDDDPPITIVNRSNQYVHYSDESGTKVGTIVPAVSGAPGGIHRGYIDAITVDNYKDRIFKVPGWPNKIGHTYGKVLIYGNGNVYLEFYGLGNALKTLKLRSGWITKKRLIKNGNFGYYKPLFELLEK